MWRVCREAGRPWPVLSDDDVIDYMVMEAVALRAKKQEENERKAAERERWKQEQQERLKQMTQGK